MRNSFKIGTMLAAIGAMFRSPAMPQLAEAPQTHDDFHVDRGAKHSRGTGRPGVRKYRLHRAVKNEMAHQSRKRNK